MRSIARLVPLLFVVGLAALPALAGGVAVIERSGTDALTAGDLHALTLDADGILRPGPTFTSLPLDADTAWAALPQGDHLWIGTGNQGELLRVGANGKIQRIPTGSSVLVTALAPLGAKDVAAAVFPGGRLVRVSDDGTAKTLATLPVEHVWALLPDGRGGLVAATGLPGALFHVDAFGAVSKLADIGDDHARSLARRGDAWLVGTSPKGHLVEVRGERVKVIRDLEQQEIVGILPLDDGGILVAANEDQAGGNAQTLAGLLSRLMKPEAPQPDKPPKERPAIQDGSVLWLEPDGAVTVLWAKKKVAALSLARDGSGAVLGTYPSGRVIHVEPKKAWSLVADFEEAEASVVLGGADGFSAVVTSNPAVLHRRAKGALKGSWTSDPLDAGAVARWGRVEGVGEGIRKLEVRAGETERPDSSWTDWKEVASFDGRGGQADLRARFLEVRATIAGESAELRATTAVAAVPDRRPDVQSLTVTRPDVAAGTIPEVADPTRKVQWKADDPDGDDLSVHLEAQRLGSAHWISLIDGEVLDKPEFIWDTSGLPDGVYRLRLTVSDSPDTPARDARQAERSTGPIRVDNTPPRVKVTASIAKDALLVGGEAVDQEGGRLALLRACVDGGDWVVLAAADGILDGPAEAFEGRLPLPGSGPHDVVVQARDADGNVGAAATVVRVP